MAVSTACVAVGTIAATLMGVKIGANATTVVIYFSIWAIFALTYSVLTWRTLGRADAATLRYWMDETVVQQRRWRLTQTLLGTGGTSGAISLAAVALGAVVIVAILPTLRNNSLVVALAVVVVAASWVLLVTVLAVRYASEDPKKRTVRFPGPDDHAPVFSDYYYLAVQIVTTFSSSDVSIIDPLLRREVTKHTVIAFAFNTIIVALLISLLITAGG